MSGHSGWKIGQFGINWLGYNLNMCSCQSFSAKINLPFVIRLMELNFSHLLQRINFSVVMTEGFSSSLILTDFNTSIFIVRLQRHYVKTPFKKLRNIELGQYLGEWPFGNTRSGKHAPAGSVADQGPRWKTRGQSANSLHSLMQIPP